MKRSALDKTINGYIIEILRNFNNKGLIIEASKKNILINKIGLTEENAKILDDLCGPMSVWMINKLIPKQEAIMREWRGINEPIPREDVIKRMNTNQFINHNIEGITSIMDYIRIGLNGNASSIKDLDFSQLKSVSKKWHDTLEIGNGKINYIEPHTHDIILDFRKDGVGYYWVALNTNYSKEECDRMGHCGRSSYGNLYSLREDIKMPGGKYTLNKSLLTASISDDGVLYQLKGPKNSKPNEKYHNLILPLFSLVSGEDDEYLINSFGSEYASNVDFKLSDLPTDVILKVYDERPELFESKSLQRLLKKMGIIEMPDIPLKFTLELDSDDISKFVDGDYLVSRRRKNKEGNYVGRDVGLFETILSGDVWDLYQNWDADWKSAIEYNVNQENIKKIIEILTKTAESKGINVEGMGVTELLEEVDDGTITGEISSCINDAESDDYVRYLKSTLEDCLEEYGVVTQFNEEGIKINIDLEKYLKDINEEEFDDLMETFDNHVESVFKEMVYNGSIDKPRFYTDDRWYPDINDEHFNENLKYRLMEFE